MSLRGLPSQQKLDAAIDEQGPKLAALGREAIRAAQTAMPTTNRIVDQSDGLLRIHFASGTTKRTVVLTVSFHAYWISYDFPYGDRLIDLDELLRRSDRGSYHYVVEGPDDVSDFEISMLLRDAAERSEFPPNPENRAKLLFRDELGERFG